MARQGSACTTGGSGISSRPERNCCTLWLAGWIKVERYSRPSWILTEPDHLPRPLFQWWLSATMRNSETSVIKLMRGKSGDPNFFHHLRATD